MTKSLTAGRAASGGYIPQGVATTDDETGISGVGGVPKTILSLFDLSGSWSQPYREAGHNVVQIDLKLGVDVMDINAEWLMENVMEDFGTVDAILAAPPCTDFAVSGAQYWPVKDKDGRTAKSVELVRQVLRCVEFCKPDWWALENPVGRIAKLVPELGKPWYFQPWWFGDAYTKKTGLWGNFNRALPRREVEPVRVCSQGSWIQALGGKSERTKALRSETPKGFAYAFFCANNWQHSLRAAGVAFSSPTEKGYNDKLCRGEGDA